MATRVPDIALHQLGPEDVAAAIRHLPVAIIIAEAPAGRLICANERAEQVWGSSLPLPSSVADYSRCFTGFRPDGREYAADEWPMVRALTDGEAVVDEEIEFLLPGGRRLILQVSAAPVRDEHDRITAAMVAFHDVTDQRNEERRRDFMMRLSDELRVLHDPVAIMETAAVATGEQLAVRSVSCADIEASGTVAVVHAEYRNGRVAAPSRYHLDEFGGALLERLQNGEIVIIEDVVTDPRALGDPFELWGIRSALAVPLIRDGSLVALFSVLHDAPRRWSRSDVALVRQVAGRTWQAVESARAQTDLRQSREWLGLALRAGSAAIWEWDLRSGEIHWSEEHDELLGGTPSRRVLTFARWLAMVHPEDRASCRAAARRIAAMRDGEVELEFRFASRARWINMRGRVIADARGIAERVVGVAVDTTERKGTELQREELLRQAREASEAKSHFISVLSHEFRTPLTAIIGYTDLLCTGVSGQLSPAQERQLERIRTSAWHLAQLVDEILTFTRIEGGGERVSLQPTDVLTIARDTVALVGPGAAAKKLALNCELPDTPITLHTDGGKLRQILLNLLGNAVKFTERGGVSLRVREVDGAVEFTVSDTGVGIPPEHLERIFDRFWQARQEPLRFVSGAGLGLTVSRQLAELLDAELTVRSEPGAGSAFTLRLPRT